MQFARSNYYRALQFNSLHKNLLRIVQYKEQIYAQTTCEVQNISVEVKLSYTRPFTNIVKKAKCCGASFTRACGDQECPLTRKFET